MKKENLEKTQRLIHDIKEMEEFLEVFCDFKNIKRGDGTRDITGLIKINTETKISIFGSRYYGIGRKEKEISLPYEMVSVIEKSYYEKLNELNNVLHILLNE